MFSRVESKGVMLDQYSELDTLCTGMRFIRERVDSSIADPILCKLPAEEMMVEAEDFILSLNQDSESDDQLFVPLSEIQVTVAAIVLGRLITEHPDEFEAGYCKDMLLELKDKMRASRDVADYHPFN